MNPWKSETMAVWRPVLQRRTDGRTLSAAALPSLLLLEMMALAMAGPFLLNDGPAHVSMAAIPIRIDEAGSWLQRRVFERNPTLSPNLLGGLILGALLPLAGPEIAESLLQALCVTALPLCGWLALSQVSRDARWLAVLLVPMGLTQMFFFGLYNFVLSISGFLLVVAAGLTLRRRPSLPRAALLGGALLLVLACHAAGLVMSLAALAAMLAADTAFRLRRGERPAAVLRRQVPALLACAPALALFGVFLAGRAGSATEHGGGLLVRLARIATLRQLGVNGRDTWILGCLLALTAVLLACVALVLLRRRWATMPPEARLRAAVAWSLPPVLLLVALAIPDTSGGGWTHARRAELFPYLGLVLALGAAPVPAALRVAATAVAAAVSVALLALAVYVQAALVRPEMDDLMRADALVGEHCTVLPVVFEMGPVHDDGSARRIGYSPFFQGASRLELRGDRVVLFNFLARLAVYPLAFRPGVDPAELLFHWRPEQADPEARVLDIPRFEARTGLRVDYVLVWGWPADDRQALWAELQDRLRDGYAPVPDAAAGRMRLFRRAGEDGSCARAPPG